MKGTFMDFSITSREGYAVVTDNETGEALLTVPWKNGQTMCFTVIGQFAEHEDAVLAALAFGMEGILPMDHMPEEVRNLADPQTQQHDAAERDAKAVAAEAATVAAE
jgi:hypothetical protein